MYLTTHPSQRKCYVTIEAMPVVYHLLYNGTGIPADLKDSNEITSVRCELDIAVDEIDVG